jgi:predicted ribosome quality control (RQC) complex YloA/Tae2 family protein
LPDVERKKVMSSFDISAVVSELRELLIGKYIDNIYQLNNETFLLKFRPENRSLIVEVGKRIHLTNYSITVPTTPSQLCMVLRKYLRDGKMTGLMQYHFERIVVMEIESSEGKFQLVAEIFSRGNLILVGSNQKIVLALRYARMRDRDIVRGGDFVHAPSSGLDPLEVKRSDLESLRTSDPMPTARKLTKILAAGGIYAREILSRAGVSETTPSNLLSDAQLEIIYEAIKGIASDLRDNRSPQILVDESGTFLTVQPFPLRIYEGIRTVAYTTFNQAADEYFSSLAHGLKDTAEAKSREQEREKLARILDMQMREEKNLQDEIARYTRIGEIIKIHTQEIGDLAKLIQAGRSRGESFSEISKSMIESAKRVLSAKNQFKGLNPKDRVFSVQMQDEEFTVGFEDSPHRSASNYFDKAKSLKQKLENVSKSIADTRSELESFKIKAEEEAREGTPLIKRKEREWYERFHWFKSSEDFLVLAGRDASTNEVLINRYTDKDDVVFHAEVQGAPFVTIKTGGKVPGDLTLSEAAAAAASYSRAWSSGFSSADVYWVKPEQLSKKPPSGQYLGRGMFMVYGQRNYVKGVPLRVAIGIIEKDGELTLISGPRTAVENKTRSFVELIPGKTRSAALAKKILYKLSKKVSGDAAKMMKTLMLEEVQRMIPSGTGEIVE